MTEQILRYVPHADVPDYLACGWGWGAPNFGDLGLPHSQYCALLHWPCQCRCVEPRRPLPGYVEPVLGL
jgi:hypothetical protein